MYQVYSKTRVYVRYKVNNKEYTKSTTKTKLKTTKVQQKTTKTTNVMKPNTERKRKKKKIATRTASKIWVKLLKGKQVLIS